MQILVNMKQLGAKRDRFKAIPFPLQNPPATVRDLLTECVRTCVADFRSRAAAAPQAYTEEELAARAELGKLAFGVHYNETEVDEEKAVQTALQAFEDGLVRVLIGEAQPQALDDPLTLHEDDTVTFLRLTFLSGRLW